MTLVRCLMLLYFLRSQFHVFFFSQSDVRGRRINLTLNTKLACVQTSPISKRKYETSARRLYQLVDKESFLKKCTGETAGKYNYRIVKIKITFKRHVFKTCSRTFKGKCLHKSFLLLFIYFKLAKIIACSCVYM